MKEFKVGDNVKLSDLFKARYSDKYVSPHDEIGTVVEIRDSCKFYIKVEWKYAFNLYTSDDLEGV
jgi:hypothetical protein